MNRCTAEGKAVKLEWKKQKHILEQVSSIRQGTQIEVEATEAPDVNRCNAQGKAVQLKWKPQEQHQGHGKLMPWPNNQTYRHRSTPRNWVLTSMRCKKPLYADWQMPTMTPLMQSK